MSFRHRLALFLVVTLIAIQGVTATFAYTFLRHDLVERGKRELAAAMGVFTRQLTFLSDRVTDGVNVLSLDYALRAAIGQHDHDTELSALRNHGNRIGATRMMLVGLDGGISADTAAPQKSGEAFPFPALLTAAAADNQGTALATLGGQIYWIVVVPVRAPVPIAFIAACIPVNDVLLQKLREISSVKRSVVLASLGQDGQWIISAKSMGLKRHFHLPTAARLTQSEAALTREDGSEFLTVTAPLKTAAGSAPVVAIMDYPLDDALAAYRSLVIPMLLVLGFGLLAALVGATLIVQGVSRPLEILASAAKRIASGDYSPPPRLEQRDELGHLADALINMTQSIAERETALKNAVEAMEMARNQAVQANEAKSQFLANMSHELRTPLNAIVGFSEMMEQQVLGPIGVPRYAEYAHDINGSAEHLRGLVDRMLDLAEAESQRLAIARAPVSPGHLLKESVSALELFARQSGVRVHLRDDIAAWPLVDGDEGKLRQAFTNLVHNAIKFTPSGGEVEISATSRNNRLAIRIADNGIGMEPDLLPSVVRPFHRLKHAFDGQHQGAGIGLPFAKVVIELHGGTLLLSSAVGVGTTVLIELPVAAGALYQRGVTKMRKLLPLLFLLLGAMPAQAMDFGFDGYVDGRIVAPGDERPWLDGGLGKLRYGNGDVSAQFAGAVGQGYVLLTPEILAVAVIRVEPEQRKFLDALEAYIRYRPVSTTAWRWSLKVGAFFPPFSLENTELGWTSYWTLTPSAINSWVGDELRTIGGESSLEWRREEGTLTFIGALFGNNDPAGVIMADRGWAMDDRPTGLFDHLSVPDATLISHGAPFPDDTPIFTEYDDRLGWYAGASWDDAMNWHVELLRYDNRADPSAHYDDYFAWRTRFWSAGFSYKMDEFTLLAQGMKGDTAIEPFGGFYSTTGFDAAYALLGWERDQWRAAVRGDVFNTRNYTTSGPGRLGENGRAVTASVSWLPKDWLRLTGEVLAIDSKRPERAIVGVDPRQTETQTQLSVRIYF